MHSLRDLMHILPMYTLFICMDWIDLPHDNDYNDYDTNDYFDFIDI